VHGHHQARDAQAGCPDRGQECTPSNWGFVVFWGRLFFRGFLDAFFEDLERRSVFWGYGLKKKCKFTPIFSSEDEKMQRIKIWRSFLLYQKPPKPFQNGRNMYFIDARFNLI
jgi:hypothetical protein